MQKNNLRQAQRQQIEKCFDPIHHTCIYPVVHMYGAHDTGKYSTLTQVLANLNIEYRSVDLEGDFVSNGREVFALLHFKTLGDFCTISHPLMIILRNFDTMLPFNRDKKHISLLYTLFEIHRLSQGKCSFFILSHISWYHIKSFQFEFSLHCIVDVPSIYFPTYEKKELILLLEQLVSTKCKSIVSSNHFDKLLHFFVDNCVQYFFSFTKNVQAYKKVIEKYWKDFVQPFLLQQHLDSTKMHYHFSNEIRQKIQREWDMVTTTTNTTTTTINSESSTILESLSMECKLILIVCYLLGTQNQGKFSLDQFEKEVITYLRQFQLGIKFYSMDSIFLILMECCRRGHLLLNDGTNYMESSVLKQDLKFQANFVCKLNYESISRIAVEQLGIKDFDQYIKAYK